MSAFHRCGEVVHYLARHGESRVAKAAIISAVPRDGEDGGQSRGLPKEVFDNFQAQSPPIARNSIATFRRAFLWVQPAGRETLGGIIQNWWRQE